MKKLTENIITDTISNCEVFEEFYDIVKKELDMSYDEAREYWDEYVANSI